jgi:cytochrome c5
MSCSVATLLDQRFQEAAQFFTVAESNMNDNRVPFAERVSNKEKCLNNRTLTFAALRIHRSECKVCHSDKISKLPRE